jgi:hypothetical protein
MSQDVQMSELTAEEGLVLDADLMMEFSGSEALTSVSSLILRGLGLTNVAALKGACNVVSISLSHNELRDIPLGANVLPCLTELNVNSNRLSQLDWVRCCPKLEHLYASCNSFSDVSPLGNCPGLTKACLHGNAVDDLDGSLEVLSALTKLTELELDGNPCESVSGYKHLVIAKLPELKRLDCATILASDRDKARSFAAYQQSHKGTSFANKENEQSGAFFTHSDISLPEQYASAKATRRRPTTSHQNSKQYRDSTFKPSSAALARSLASTSIEVLKSMGPQADTGPQDGRLFRDDFLNQNPILVEYMTQAALEDETSHSEGAHANGDDEDADDDSNGGEAAAHRAARSGKHRKTPSSSVPADVEAAEDSSDGDVQLLDVERQKQHRRRSGTASSGASTRPQTGEGGAAVTGRSRRGFASELRQVTAALSG